MIDAMSRGGSVEDVAIVGAGIVGLAHAWSAARRGHRVTVFERGAIASGASVRNFGMVWPIGQPPGEARAIALRSRDAWLEVASEAGVWVNRCGSIHLAHRDDEWAVLEDFAATAPELGYDCKLLTREEIARHTHAANPDGLIGGLFSLTELGVDPRSVIRTLPGWLSGRFGVRFHFGVTITDVEPGKVRGSEGRCWDAHRVVVCGGADFETLFPTLLRESGLRRCKLQMLKTVRQPAGWSLGPHLASGLTLRHYANFAAVPSIAALRNRIAEETPELDRWGIHVMASQNDAGEIIIGDSHEYDSAVEPFDKAEIDDLILRELRRVIRLPDWSIAERWHGVYAKHDAQPLFEADPLPGVHVRTGTGGAGMTMSFGLAERSWERWT
ncbi:MAG: TIGR03364 family FAD-dependent oxidoreductase [Paludisphaera borealis]|uniref:TIGR03364 family FAD-dependent oxidoreductase n=1 Tax=Paludisphaera borealis TaxID=1387353 RepID=UPI002845EAA7|nr:TIGR03364 family FAD-dependent oxidoreductase [Paludisphaera borealis]MDR3621398.1 TIGR03364 family FAD-dependent oxidoreductase [Paludisphaera borealis]